jgi:hypothetical protein
MSEENVEIARAAIEATLRRPKPDYDTMNVLFHPDHQYLSLLRMVEGGKVKGTPSARTPRQAATRAPSRSR